MLPNSLRCGNDARGHQARPVMIPATTLLEREDCRSSRARPVKAIVTDAGLAGASPGCGCAAADAVDEACRAGWGTMSHAAVAQLAAQAPTRARICCSVLHLRHTHSRSSSPYARELSGRHLSTMYWLGLKPGDVHLNLSSRAGRSTPGRASSRLECQATILAYQYERFEARALLEQLVRCRVTSFCAPPTVWRMLIQSDLRAWRVSLRNSRAPANASTRGDRTGARCLGLTIRDGFGQTETPRRSAHRGAASNPARWGARLPDIRSCCSARTGA